MHCPICGGRMTGDGCNIAFSCENKELLLDVEPDSGPHYCDGDPTWKSLVEDSLKRVGLEFMFQHNKVVYQGVVSEKDGYFHVLSLENGDRMLVSGGLDFEKFFIKTTALEG